MFIIELPIVMVRCLVCTILIETIIALLIGIRDKKDYLNIILVNIVTNPLVVVFPIAFYIQYGNEAKNISIIILEIFAFLFEGIIYCKYLKYKKTNGFLISFLLNFCSYFIGELINYILYN